MSCCETKALMSLEQTLEKMQCSLKNICESISLPLSQTLGYALAQDICSPLDVPGFDNSAMDGYAIHQADLIDASLENPVSLKMVGKSFAGSPYRGELARGCCVRIMTGAVMPDCADTVVMQEHTSVERDLITFTQQARIAEHVRRAGGDIQTGQMILSKGHRVTARDIALIASVGLANVQVFRKLKVAVISSGDELKELSETLKQGDIYDCNRYSLIALLSRLNVEVFDFGIIKDDKASLAKAFSDADLQTDVIISSGGVSVGEADLIKEVALEMGNLQLWKVAIKPGKPFAFGKLANSTFFGLPGNPVSAMVTLYQLAVPALLTMGGFNVQPAVRFTATVTENLKKLAGRTDFQRGSYRIDENGQLLVSSTGHQGSNILSSISQSNCFIVLERDRGNVKAGEMVLIEPYNALMD